MRSAVIVAGGVSSRYGANKLAEPLFDGTVLTAAVDAFRGIADEIVVVGAHVDGTIFAEGGDTRTQSVLNGLNAVSDGCDVVAVHDGARPFVSRALVERLFAEAERFGSAVPATPVTDTVWYVDDVSKKTIRRENLLAVQTPQIFDFAKLTAAFADAIGESFTDESTLYFAKYGDVHFVDGETSNKKITYDGDLPDFRTGAGFDVHAFGEGNGVRLGGVDIPFNKSLVGHSDADVVCHAICDAVLSAANKRDIGHLFPVDDDRYLGANSMDLLRTCVDVAAKDGFEVVNCSVVIVCEAPKIAPHIDNMKKALAAVLNVAENAVSVSATTSEKLGALGHGDGIASEAQVLLKRCKRSGNRR